jgi:hypothetical protein
MVLRELGAEAVRNVVIKKNPHAGTSRPRSSSSLNFRR